MNIFYWSLFEIIAVGVTQTIPLARVIIYKNKKLFIIYHSRESKPNIEFIHSWRSLLTKLIILNLAPKVKIVKGR